jgi:capsule polysaccharide export protein KpsE/RkpR
MRHNSLRQNSTVREFEPITPPEFPRSDEKTQLSLTERWLPTLRLLWGHRRFLYKAAIWGIIISTILVFLLPRRYESKVSLMPPDTLGGSSSAMVAMATKANPALAALASELLGAKKTGALFAELLKSRSVQDPIVDRFQLQKVYWKRYKEDARDKLEGRTTISEDRKSGVLSIEVTDSDPKRARDIAQAYVEELNRLVALVSTSSARSERKFIEQRLVGVKVDLEDAERQFSAFSSEHAVLDIKEQAKATVESAAVLQGQLIAAQSELQGLEQIYTPNNVRVKSSRARVAELQRQLQRIGGTNTPDDSGKPDEIYPPIRKLPLLGVEWADLYRRVKIQETVYELLNEQYELARIQEAKEIPTVNVIDPADLPEKKSFPPRLVLIVSMTLLTLLCAAAWTLMQERWARIVPGDPRRQFLTEVGGSVAKGVAGWPVFSRFAKLNGNGNPGIKDE